MSVRMVHPSISIVFRYFIHCSLVLGLLFSILLPPFSDCSALWASLSFFPLLLFYSFIHSSIQCVTIAIVNCFSLSSPSLNLHILSLTFP
ncbi:hypothetical protein F5H01DRAFT_329995 [Linnemannia elongata]|nr:hypothetical protein F5H01DRAFT_329995 [Linnemannia elongata]